MKQKTRKLMTMHKKALHPRNNVDRFYVSSKERSSEIVSIDDHRDASTQGLEKYIKKEKD